MSLQLQFFFPCFFGVSPFSMGHPFFLWGSSVLASARGLAAVASGVRGWFARPPASHAPANRHAQPVRAGVFPFFIPFLLFVPFLLFAPVVKGSQPRVRPPCACMSRVCMSRVRWQPCGCVACCTLPLYTFVSTATSCSAYKYKQSSQAQPFTIVKIQ